MIRQDGDRRWKRYCVSPYVIMNLFLDWNIPGECFSQARIMDVPENYIIEDIEYSMVQQCFIMLIYHPSFPNIPLGELPLDVVSVVEGFFLPKYYTLHEALEAKIKPEKDQMMKFFKGN